MTKAQIILSITGLILIIVLYQLPRVVVSNDDEARVENHDFSISKSEATIIDELKLSLRNGNSDNYFNFADSLAKFYLKYGFLDSAENLIEKYMLIDSSLLAKKKSAALLYSIYERSVNPEEIANRGAKAKSILAEIVVVEPDNLVIKNMLAMTLVNTENPMAAIQLLREILAVDSTNREATINLGLLAIQSGQYDRAVDRFESIVRRDTLDYEVHLYLGIALMESGKTKEANEKFTWVANALEADPALKAAALEYLK